MIFNFYNHIRNAYPQGSKLLQIQQRECTKAGAVVLYKWIHTFTNTTIDVHV